MNPKAAYLAAGAFLLLAACGGSDSGNASAGASASSDPAPPPPISTSTTRSCKAGLETTVVGGDLFVAEPGAVGMTLLSNGGLTQYLFWVIYDNVIGIPAISNRQDKFGAAQPFPPGTQPGAAVQLQLQPPSPYDLNGQTLPASFPKGIPVELLLRNYDGGPVSETNTFTTAAIGKDIWPDGWPRATVTYGPNNTATVTFFAGFSVGLANVCGSGSAL